MCVGGGGGGGGGGGIFLSPKVFGCFCLLNVQYKDVTLLKSLDKYYRVPSHVTVLQ